MPKTIILTMSKIDNMIPPKLELEFGAKHPINHVKDTIMDSLSMYGFNIVEGPEVESEEYNFDMLNIKEHHPLDKCMIHFMLIQNHMS